MAPFPQRSWNGYIDRFIKDGSSGLIVVIVASFPIRPRLGGSTSWRTSDPQPPFDSGSIQKAETSTVEAAVQAAKQAFE